MSDRGLVITWGGIAAVVAIVMGCSTLMSIYAPPKPKETARQTCAYYETARGSAFCMEIARSGRDD